MRLADAARFFDRLPMVDAYSLAEVGNGQWLLFDDSVRDGVTVERRVISTKPALAMPPRRVVKAGDLYWIVGDLIPDYFGDEMIRAKYVAQQATGLATLKTVTQALQAAAGTTAYAGLVWSKAAKEVDESSGMYNLYTLTLAQGETLTEGMLCQLAGTWYWVRTVYTASAGFLTAAVDQLYDPVFETLNYTAQAYNPVTDAYTSTTTSVPVLRLRWQSHFEYLSPASDKYLPGDLAVLMLKGGAVTPKAGDVLPLSGGSCRVLSVVDEGTYLTLHARRA